MIVFDWTDYLVLAEELGQRGDEASLRSAISRAYYAAYGMARDRLRQTGVAIRTSDHKWLWDSYRDSTNNQSRMVGVNGDRLRVERNRADYDAEFPGLGSSVAIAIDRARQVLQRV